MGHRRVVTLLATSAFIALFPGCATQKNDAVARLTESDALHATLPADLVGIWNGWFRPTGGADGGGGNSMAGDMMLEIKDDATYRLIWTRRGIGDAAGGGSKDLGVVVANGGGINLKGRSSGQGIPPHRQGEA